MMAVPVLARHNGRRPAFCNIKFKIPLLDKINCHARMRRIKFIHIGKIRINSVKPCRPMFSLRIAITSGYERRMQIIVQPTAISREKSNAFKCTGSKIAMTLASVNAPSRLVSAYWKITSSGIMVNPATHTAYGVASHGRFFMVFPSFILFCNLRVL